MREELIRAAHATPGNVATAILRAAKQHKAGTFGGWTVIRTSQRRGKRGKRTS